MKIIKSLLIVLIIVILSGCSSDTPDKIEFDRKEFTYVGMTDDDYLLFKSGNFRLELKEEDDGSIIASYEKYQDIYLISGLKDDYKIRKNGILVQICSGEEIACTGFETVIFSKDATVLFDVFEDNSLSTTTIVVGVLIVTAIGSLFFIPKK